MTATEVRTAALFTAADRCDCCPAPATTRAVLRTGDDLVFCDHHFRRNQAALIPLATMFERHVELDEALAFVPAFTGR
ncbi:DUF7455 domain-containing protein [Actinophytocola oryzae]|uniref:DUF7455 domain-containing protein n=1 Tax=Actinophytocola oryzae TaxID=502181 RepID=A0A4R7V158_9PSEU|nr:hypothetical protein [Actinophytocola oryzae]TDV42560.1 hypothetical protein CLV71_11729 [Actinophytocola oryzae]